jgi:uncharacterized OB-fold protein
MDDQPFRLLPELGPDNEFFWTSGKDGVLRMLRCRACGYYIHPPAPICPSCRSHEVAPERVSGRATVHSYTVNHKSWDGSTEPYVIALVTLEEQTDLRLTTNLVDCDPDEVVIGMPVEVVFEDRDPVFVPLFKPAPG